MEHNEPSSNMARDRAAKGACTRPSNAMMLHYPGHRSVFNLPIRCVDLLSAALEHVNGGIPSEAKGTHGNS